MTKEARKVDDAARLRHNGAIDFPSASAQGREALHSREGIPTGSEMMSSVTSQAQSQAMRIQTMISDLLGALQRQVEPWLDQQFVLGLESTHLAAARDCLLPRLLAEEVEV